MSIYRQRLATLQRRLGSLGCDALLIDDSINLLYLTSLHLSVGRLLVSATAANLIVDGRYIEGARERSFYPVTLADESALERLLKSSDWSHVVTLGFSQEASYKQHCQLSEILQKTGREIALKPLENPLMEQRLIKDHEEIDALRQAAQLGSQGFDYLCSLVREGVTERQLAAQLEIFWLQNGGQKVAFAPIIAFDPHNSEPHYTPRQIALRRGQAILIDIGVSVDDYHSDMTRMVFFDTPSKQLLAIYEIVQSAQEAALRLCRPGVNTVDLDLAARTLIEKAGYGDAFSHSLGHGIGLEVHEAPRIHSKPPVQGMILRPGMALTIEPGIYLPGLGGIRLEDTIVITEEGYEDLTLRSKNILVIK
jgi:Xaa-Pro aminopeptidase